VLFSTPYRELLAFFDQMLPRSGKILDCGCGTGNVSAFLAYRAPGRTMHCFDISLDGLEKTRHKLALVDPRGRHLAFEHSLLDLSADLPRVDAAALNFVLHAVAGKQTALARIRNALRPGQFLVLGDPMFGDWGPNTAAETLTEVALTAWMNGSFMTEFDLAVIMEANINFLIGGSGVGERELLALLSRAGFEVVARQRRFAAAATCVVARAQ
jgi:SAM-dependent methyltransferase